MFYPWFMLSRSCCSAILSLPLRHRSLSTLASEPAKRSTSLFKLSIAIGAGLFSYYVYDNYLSGGENADRAGVSRTRLAFYKTIPTNCLTRLAGYLAGLQIPESLRLPLFGSYSRMFGCRLDEAEKDITEYNNFAEFFSRAIKPGLRPISKDLLVSPADGQLLHCGRIDRPTLSFHGDEPMYPEQVKGSYYPLKTLVGETIYSSFVKTSTNPIYYCTIYLSPGSYHRFHAPADYKISVWRRVRGEVLSVAPFVMRLIPRLLCLNERYVLAGSWRHGTLAVIPVGATNVRTIRVENDPTVGLDLSVSERVTRPLKVSKGNLLGRFELGSTVVLLFHGPESFRWTASPGDKIKVGQSLGA